ncbi:MAG: GNAT family N-acetyltransferase [Ignavibacteriae bacterium]|nr:GNAT family N-acetyltransferase [Ignavibacteriota bacterium]MCB9214589.1 GNAT family N-acetyltransferase [Ignavibacteria bacterium]
MQFQYQPTLEGNLLRLRPLLAEDFDVLYSVASDPLIWEQHPVSERYREDVFREFFREAMESGGALVAIDVASGKMIGSSRYYEYNQEKSEVEIGWTFLARSYWGGAYNREMKRLMVEHAFQFVESVIFLIGPQNFRSQKAVEKIGAVLDGRRDGVYGQEHLVYRLHRDLTEQLLGV